MITSAHQGLGYTVIRVRNENVVSFDMNRLKGNKNRKPCKNWKKNHQPKEEQKPFMPLEYSQEYIKRKIAENREKKAQQPNPLPNKVYPKVISIDPNDTASYSKSKQKKGFGIKIKVGVKYGTGR